MEKAVSPPKLRGDLFTNSTIDNIDHNKSSTTAQGLFHGTGISFFQHARHGANRAERIRMTPLDKDHMASERGFGKLTQSYTDVPPVIMSKKNAVPPEVEGPNKPDCSMIPQGMQTEYR